MIRNVNPKRRVILIVLTFLLICCLSLLGAILVNPNLVPSAERKIIERDEIVQDLAVVYVLEKQPNTNSIKLGFNSYDGINSKYKIYDIEEERFDKRNFLENINKKDFPAYVSILKNDKGLYYIKRLDSIEINDLAIKRFTENLDKYLNLYSDIASLNPYQKLWIAAEGSMKMNSDKAKKIFLQYVKELENSDIQLIVTNEFGTDYAYLRNYARNYPYTCFVSQRLKEIGITKKDYNKELCNLPQILPVNKNHFNIENIESIVLSGKFSKDTDSDNIQSTTFLIDSIGKSKEELQEIYAFSLSEAQKHEFGIQDLCYWMLVNDLTDYKNTLYNHVIYNEDIFNAMNNMYCPSLHLPAHFKHIKEPKALDINYLFFDL